MPGLVADEGIRLRLVAPVASALPARPSAAGYRAASPGAGCRLSASRRFAFPWRAARSRQATRGRRALRHDSLRGSSTRVPHGRPQPSPDSLGARYERLAAHVLSSASVAPIFPFVPWLHPGAQNSSRGHIPVHQGSPRKRRRPCGHASGSAVIRGARARASRRRRVAGRPLRPTVGAAVAAPSMPLYPSSGSMLSPFADGLYRLVYGGLLVRLPEATAVRIGQSLFRSLPVAPLRALAVDDPRLAVDLAGVRLPGPLILSSMYYDPRILRRAMALGFGAVTAKSITLGPRPGHPEPNLVRVTTPAGPGLVNCNGFQNPGLDAFRTDALRAAPRPPAHPQRRRRVPRGVPAAGREPSSRTRTSSRSTSRRQTRVSSTSCQARRRRFARCFGWSARPRGSR